MVATQNYQPTILRWTKLLHSGLVLALLAWGLWSQPIAMFGPERSMVPGGELTRQADLVLEHFHRYASGKEEHYWNATFMFPQANAMRYGENLLGTAPVHSAARWLGASRGTAMQVWVLILFALNYGSAFLVIRAWMGSAVLAASGAYLFAFGLPGIALLGHPELFPRAMVPVALYLLWRALRSGERGAMILAAVALAYQFWCSIALGQALTMAMALLLVAQLMAHRKSTTGVRYELRVLLRNAAYAAAVLALLTAPLMRVALIADPQQSTNATGVTAVTALFQAHPSALSWLDLIPRASAGELIPASHWFIGGLPWLALFVAVLVLARKRGPSEERIALRTTGTALVLCISVLIVAVLLNRTTQSPAASALPPVLLGLVQVQTLFFALVLVMLYALLEQSRGRTLLEWSLPLLLLLDGRVDVSRCPRYDKHASRAAVDQVIRHVQEQRRPGTEAVAYLPVIPVASNELRSEMERSSNTTALMAAQELGSRILNGPWDGKLPDVSAWCKAYGCDPTRIAVIDNIGLPMSASERIGLALVKDSSSFTILDRRLVLRENDAQENAYFVLVYVGGDKVALLAPNNRFVYADVLKDAALYADAPEVGDHAMFTLVEGSAGQFALRADNGRYVVPVGEERRSFAVSDSIVPSVWLRAMPLPANYR